MKYILLSQYRSGTSYLYSYMKEFNLKHNQMCSLGEYYNLIYLPIVLPDRITTTSIKYDVADHNNSYTSLNLLRNIVTDKKFNHIEFIKKKYDLLVSEQSNNKEYSIKLTASQFFTIFDDVEYMKNRILPFYTDYTFILLTRNLFDVFISREVQQYIKWKQPHGDSRNITILDDMLIPFNIDRQKVLNFLDQQDWVQDVNTTVKNNYNYIEIDYDSLTEEYLENLFGLKLQQNHKLYPLSTNYKKYIINYDEIKSTFYKLM